MNKLFYFLSILLISSVTVSLYAQLPGGIQVSSGANEYWYYIQNGANPEMAYVDAVTINDNADAGLDKAGLFITSQGGDNSNQVYSYVRHINQNGDLQLWKVVEADNGSYDLINKKTGNKLALGTGSSDCYGDNGVNCKDLFYTNSDGNQSFSFLQPSAGDKGTSGAVVITYSQGADTYALITTGVDKKWSLYNEKMVDEYDIPEDDAIIKSTKAWFFISESEMNTRPYPLLSSSASENWYHIELLGTQTYVTGRAIEARLNSTTSEYYIGSLVKKADNEYQMWKVVSVAGDNAKVNLVNKMFPNKYFPLPNADAGAVLSDTPVDFLLKDVRNGELSIMIADETKNNSGRSGVAFRALTWQVPGVMAISTVNADQTIARRYTSTFKFTAAEGGGSGIVNPGKASFIAYSDNGYIKVEGTSAPAQVYSVTGILFDINKQLPAGIYIVKVANESVKVIVR